MVCPSLAPSIPPASMLNTAQQLALALIKALTLSLRFDHSPTLAWNQIDIDYTSLFHAIKVVKKGEHIP